MQVGMEFIRVFAKCVDGHYNTGNPVLQTNHFSQKGQQASVCTLTQACQQGPVILFNYSRKHLVVLLA
jgi:hypothetical protein